MNNSQRFLEIDLLRTAAIVAMVIYHLLYDLVFYYGIAIDLSSIEWLMFRRITASLFLGLVGMSFSFSWKKQTHGSFQQKYRKYAIRGFGLLSCAMAISLVTLLVDPSSYIRFGVLHAIGASLFVLPLITRLKLGLNAILGLVIIALSTILPASVGTPILIPLGIPTPNFVSVDYFPLVPWLGVIVLGFVIGSWIYKDRTAAHHASTTLKLLAWPGRNSLAIYLVHQPLLLLLLRFLLR